MTLLSLCLLSYSFSGQAVILQFLASSMPPCLGHLDKQSAYLKTRTQLFNKRKSKQCRPSCHPTVPDVVDATMSGSSGQTKCILEDEDTVVQQKEK